MIDDETYEAALGDPDNQRLMRLASHTFRDVLDVDERLQLMRIGLLRCLETFDRSHGSSFAASLYRCTWMACASEAVRERKWRSHHTQDTPPEPHAGAFPERDDVRERLGRMGARDRELLSQYHWEGMRVRELGEAHGWSREKARRLLRRAERRFAAGYYRV